MIASLPMYDFPEVRAHTDALWEAIAVALRAAGVSDVPDARTVPDGDLVEHWRRRDLLLSHTCGYPVVRLLPDAHVLGSFAVAAGDADAAGRYRAVLVARSTDERSAGGLVAFDGARLAANDDGSLSGWVSLGWALGQAGVQPGPVTFTGQHAASVVAVRDSVADLASIDAHTFALLQRHRPQAVEGLVVVGHGPDVAVTPLITMQHDLVPVLRDAVAAAVASMPPAVLSALMITGWVPHGRADHDPVRDLAATALAVLPG